MNQIEIAGHQYQVEKMPPREQFHVLRRISPLMTALGTAALGLLDDGRAKEDVIAEMVASVGPLAGALSSMKDEELDYVLDHCLARVKRLDSDHAWHPIYVQQPRGAARMYQDVDLVAELRLCAEVIRENTSGFFALLSGGSAPSLSAST